MNHMFLDVPVIELDGIGPKRAANLERLGISTCRDLLYHFPRDYQDRREVVHMDDVEVGRRVMVRGTVKSARVVRLRGRLSLTRAKIVDDTGSLTATWFNQPWIKNVMRPGKEGFFVGEIGRYSGLQIKNPEFEMLTGTREDTIHTGRIVPIYSLTEGFSQRQIRALIWNIVSRIDKKMPDDLPVHLVDKMKFGPMADSLKTVHFPESMEAVQSARRRFAFTELLHLQLPVVRAQKQRAAASGIAHTVNGPFLSSFRNSLPFHLTQAQRRVLETILTDMAADRPMMRLMQGDVGCGKTVVALHAICAAADGGYQTAFMAPTEILAEQHYLTLRETLEPLGITTDILTGSLTAGNAGEVRDRIRDGRVKVVVGTHALFQSSVEFERLGLAVIDEQQRFGVAQRARLQKKGTDCDVLTMTATPIPRSLALTVYGATDISAIDEMPPDRLPVDTKHFKRKKRDEMYRFIRERAGRGEQTYIVCPLVDESEKVEAAAATSLVRELADGPLADLKLGLLHGRLEIDKKDAVMHSFKNGDLDVIVGTTVIEVGIDVPNATIMVIEEAGRFGLAQLHQLRGRVGRGAGKSYCFLVDDLKNDSVRDKIALIRSTNDGFKIAEEDLRMRGPGDLAGFQQSGYSSLRIADLSIDMRLVETAREEAARIIERDPGLDRPEHTMFRQTIEDKKVYSA